MQKKGDSSLILHYEIFFKLIDRKLEIKPTFELSLFGLFYYCDQPLKNG